MAERPSLGEPEGFSRNPGDVLGAAARASVARASGALRRGEEVRRAIETEPAI
ncbi:MAG: hypothetical protein AB1425_08100 [Actinomycetota bacterium]